jgi:hypothetical protein
MTAMIRRIVLAMRARHCIAASVALLIAGLFCLAPERASIVKQAHAQLGGPGRYGGKGLLRRDQREQDAGAGVLQVP